MIEHGEELKCALFWHYENDRARLARAYVAGMFLRFPYNLVILLGLFQS